MKLYNIIGFMILCAVNAATTVYLWKSILVTSVPIMMVGLSFCCSILFLFEPGTKKLTAFTYLILAFMIIFGISIVLFIRRPIGILIVFSSATVLCKNFLSINKYRKKEKLKVKVLSAIFLITAVFITGFSSYRFIQDRQTGLANGQDTMWDAECEMFFGEICADAKSDEDVAHAAYDWVSRNIRYDNDYNDVYQFFNCRRTLSTKKGLCYDYSNLFAAICRSQGVPCFCIDGTAKKDIFLKHTFNRVFWGGTWWTVDVTCDAQPKNTIYGFHRCNSLDDPDDTYFIDKIY